MPRFNCCIFNHPCPIRCPLLSCGCRNEIVNPEFGNDFGFFNNTAVGEIASQTTIPVSLVTSEGTSIVSNGAGGVTLAAGAYEVSYLANGTVPVKRNAQNRDKTAGLSDRSSLEEGAVGPQGGGHHAPQGGGQMKHL